MQIPNKIGQFIRYNKKPSSMKFGYYYTFQVTLPFSKENKRMVRVWLPEDYDFDNPEKRYPVIYMSDGQNLVDKYLSAYGEWELDKCVHRLMAKGLQGVIAVGLDCPKDPKQRIKELCPPYLPRKEVLKKEKLEKGFVSYADKYIDYLADKLKPLIDSLFFTMPEKECTGVGGSSMGGIMSYYAYIYRPDVFGFALSFSPAFFFYKKNDWFKINDEYDIRPDKNGKLFLYTGGKDFEKIFLKPTMYTYQYLRKHKFKNNQLAMIVDTNQIHHEAAWAKYLADGLSFWLKD